jgi:hypothetical protein
MQDLSAADADCVVDRKRETAPGYDGFLTVRCEPHIPPRQYEKSRNPRVDHRSEHGFTAGLAPRSLDRVIGRLAMTKSDRPLLKARALDRARWSR